MVSNSIYFDGYELKSAELALYFREKWPDAQCGRKDLKTANNFFVSNLGLERNTAGNHLTTTDSLHIKNINK